MSTGWFPVTEPTPNTVPLGATLTLVIVLTGVDRETVVHVVPDLSCRVPSMRPPGHRDERPVGGDRECLVVIRRIGR